MKSGMLSNADGVLENKRRRQKWKRLAGVLGCLVMIGTTYVLMRPAETLERELICGMEEHKHSVEQGCYRQVAAEAALPICGWEEGETGHVHSDECYSEESVLTCTEPESETHRHEDSCYTTEHIQTCGLMEMKNHAHTEDCYLPADEDTETEWELICELLEHALTRYNNDIAGVYTAWDGATLAAISVLENYGLETQVQVCGYDGTANALKIMRDKEDVLNAEVGQPLYQLGEMGVETGYKVLKGESVAAQQSLDCILITPENFESYISEQHLEDLMN